MADFIVKNPASDKFFPCEHMLPLRKELPDEALRARLQDLQSSRMGFAKTALASELTRREKRDARDAGKENSNV